MLPVTGTLMPAVGTPDRYAIARSGLVEPMVMLFEPRAHVAAPGTLDLCFIAAIPLEDVVQKLKVKNVAILEGPVAKTGAKGPMQSVYVRDPDLNLVEISVY